MISLPTGNVVSDSESLGGGQKPTHVSSKPCKWPLRGLTVSQCFPEFLRGLNSMISKSISLRERLETVDVGNAWLKLFQKLTGGRIRGHQQEFMLQSLSHGSR